MFDEEEMQKIADVIAEEAEPSIMHFPKKKTEIFTKD